VKSRSFSSYTVFLRERVELIESLFINLW